jgi:hypothetical protein
METEIVRDPSIIAAYVRQRQLIDEEQTDADDLRPSDDEGKNERRRKRFVPSIFIQRVQTYEMGIQAQGTIGEAQEEPGTTTVEEEPETGYPNWCDGSRRETSRQTRDCTSLTSSPLF